MIRYLFLIFRNFFKLFLKEKKSEDIYIKQRISLLSPSLDGLSDQEIRAIREVLRDFSYDEFSYSGNLNLLIHKVKFHINLKIITELVKKFVKIKLQVQTKSIISQTQLWPNPKGTAYPSFSN